MSELNLQVTTLSGDPLSYNYDTIEIITRFSELEINLFAYCKFKKMKLYKMLSLLESDIDYRKYMDMRDNESIATTLKEESVKLKSVNNTNYKTFKIPNEAILNERLRVRFYEKKELQKLRKMLKLTDIDFLQYMLVNVHNPNTGERYKLPALYASINDSVAAEALREAFAVAFGFVFSDVSQSENARKQYVILYMGQKPNDIVITR